MIDPTHMVARDAEPTANSTPAKTAPRTYTQEIGHSCWLPLPGTALLHRVVAVAGGSVQTACAGRWPVGEAQGEPRELCGACVDHGDFDEIEHARAEARRWEIVAREQKATIERLVAKIDRLERDRIEHRLVELRDAAAAEPQRVARLCLDEAFDTGGEA